MSKRLAGLGLAVFLLIGCSSQSEPQTSGIDSPSPASVNNDEVEVSPTGTPQENTTSSLGSAVDLTLLRADYYNAFDLLDVAERSLANQCMIDLGFEPLRLILPPERIERDYISELGRLALTESGASADGYLSAPLSIEAAFVDPREEAQNTLDPAIYDDSWFDAWEGAGADTLLPPAPGSDEPPAETNSGGCLGEARSDIGQRYDADGLNSSLRTAEQLWNSVFSLTDSDERYLAASALWSDCMRSAGFNYSTLIEAYADGFTAQTADPQASIDQAVADAACQAESNVIAVYDSVWIENQAAVQDSNEALAPLAWHQANFDTTLDLILTVLEESGLPVQRD